MSGSQLSKSWLPYLEINSPLIGFASRGARGGGGAVAETTEVFKLRLASQLPYHFPSTHGRKDGACESLLKFHLVFVVRFVQCRISSLRTALVHHPVDPFHGFPIQCLFLPAHAFFCFSLIF